MRRRRIAIIGAGFSGAAVAANLLAQRRAPDVVLIGQEKRFGPGLAYGARDPAHLLNVRASNMSALADQPDHFVRWLKSRSRGDVGAQFISRKRYGEYVERTLFRAQRKLGGFKRVLGAAVACRRHGEGWTISMAPGADIEADAVVLALGNAAPSPPAIFEQSSVTPLNPWDVDALHRLPPGDVLLLGAGLTMIDVALSLVKRRRKGTIYAISRRGIAPRGHLTSPAPAPPVAPLTLPAELSDAVHAFRAEVRAIGARGEPWQYAVDRMRARTPELWQRLSSEQQARFLRHLRVWWDVHRHRAAPEIAARVAELQKEGRLHVIAGEITGVRQEPPHVGAQYRKRGTQQQRDLEVAGIVNCTGASLDLRNSSDPLTRQLLDDGIARAPASGLGFDIDAVGRLIGADGKDAGEIFAVGPITQGAFWESTAVPEIRVRAAAVAQLLGAG